MVTLAHHTVVLEGPGVCEGRPSPGTAGAVLREIQSATKEAVRMGFRHSSRKPGRIPTWLSAAEDVRFVEISRCNGGTSLHFEAPRFGDVVDEPYRQPTFFDVPPPRTDTAFDLLGDIIADVAGRVADSERFDTGVLKRLEKFGRRIFVRDRGIASITLCGDRLPVDRPPRIDPELSAAAASLYRETPDPKRVRVAGKLDMIRDSDRVFNLILATGERLRGVWTGGDTAVLAGHFGQKVVIGGTGIYRPSGALLRVDAEALALAGPHDDFFSVMPQATTRTIDLKELRRKQKAGGGMAAIFGKWPGDETEEELLAALKEMG